MPEVLIPVHERSQPSVFELSPSPQLRKSFKIALDTDAAVPYNRVNVEQRPVSVKYDCLGFR
jgi:hypothetical protein